jgi:AcrR family transcriptional regulator
VSNGLPYRYFHSKAGLIAAVVDDFFDRFDEGVFKPGFEDVGDWAERERERTRRFVDFFYRDPLAPFVLAMLAGEREVIARQQIRIAEQIAAAADNIRRGQSEGAVPAELDPDLSAALVMGGLMQALVSAFERDPRPDQDTVAGALCRFVTDSLRLDAPRTNP